MISFSGAILACTPLPNDLANDNILAHIHSIHSITSDCQQSSEAHAVSWIARICMAHPFFDALSYPWDRVEATRLYYVLTKAIAHPQRIDLLYRQCKAGLPALALTAPSDEIWKAALENLAVGGALRALCDILMTTQELNNEIFKTAVRQVIGAQPAVGKQYFSDKVLMLDRTALRSHLEKLESDDDLVKVLLVRGRHASGKSHGRFLFERVARY